MRTRKRVHIAAAVDALRADYLPCRFSVLNPPAYAARADALARCDATIAVWERGTAGAWWPMKGKAVTVRVRELGEVLEGLVKAAERAAEGGAP